MDHLQWYDYVRMISAVLALISAYLLVNKNRKRSETFWFLEAFLVLTIYGQFEQIVLDVGVGFRMLLTFALVCACFVEVIRSNKLAKEES